MKFIPALIAANAVYAQECVDSSAVDRYGDGCSWYDDYSSSCGNYDWEEFTASVDCCACQYGTGLIMDDTTDCAETQTTGDIGGDGCDWY
jgi:hypothetical protein